MKSGSELPEKSRTSPEAMTKTMLPMGRLLPIRLEVITSVRLSSEISICAGTRVPLANSWTLVALTVAGFSDSLKVSTTRESGETSTVPSLGTMDRTCGAVASPAAPVVNERTSGEIVLPARSAVPFTLTAIVLPPGSGWSGVKVTRLPSTASEPASSPLMPFADTWIEPASEVNRSARVRELDDVVTGTFCAPCAGVICTVGRVVSGVALRRW